MGRTADRADLEFVTDGAQRAGQQLRDGDRDGATRTMRHVAAESTELGDLAAKAARAAGIPID